MKKILLIIAAGIILAGCSVSSPSKDYKMDLTSLNNLGHESGCPILGVKQTLIAANEEQEYWVLSQRCPAGFEPLPYTDKFSLTSAYALPKNSELVGYVFTKKRLEKSTSGFLSSISNSGLKLGGNKGVIVDNLPILDKSITVTAIFKAPANSTSKCNTRQIRQPVVVHQTRSGVA